ncbi:MAG: DUF2336 domain-containing protein [Pseudomonadota bacterium]
MSDIKTKAKTENAGAFDARALLTLAKDNSSEGRHTLTSEICEIFDQELTEEEQRLASDILLNLLQKIEIEFKELLAERLSHLASVPRSVVLNLAGDEITVAEHVLKNSQLLYDADLILLIKSKPAEYWHAIAQRKALSPVVLDTLVDTEDLKTAGHLISNDEVTMPKGVMQKLTRLAMQDHEMQRPLLNRPEIDNSLAAQLYVCVSQELRREIFSKFNIDADIIDDAVDQVLNELLTNSFDNKQVTDDLRIFARNTFDRGGVHVEALSKALRRGHQSYFLAMFALWVDLPEEAVLPLIEHQNGYGLSVVCRSQGILKSEFASLFLLSRGLRSGEKIVNQKELTKALEIFDRLQPPDAKRLLALWRKHPERI